MHRDRKSQASSSSGSSSSRQMSMAHTAPESESIFSATRGRHSTMRKDRAFGGIGAGEFGVVGPDSRSNYHHTQRQTSPDELYEIASVFKPVPGYERPWEMAPPRYWGQLRRLFLEESIRSTNRKQKEAALSGGANGGSETSSLLNNSTSSTSSTTNELDSTSGASSSSGSLSSFSLSRGSNSAHPSSSMMGNPMAQDAPMSPLWEAGHPPKHWPCLYNMKRHDDYNQHHNHGSRMHNNHVIPASRITFDQSSLGRDRPN